MKRLVSYLLENVILDFQGGLDLNMVRDFLREDNSRDAKVLLAKLVEDGGVDDMMTVLADCLQEFLGDGIGKERISEQIRMYAES